MDPVGTNDHLGFTNLPLELRKKIWVLALPDPRVLHVVRRPNPPNGIPKDDAYTEKYKVTPTSYGGHHPAILSVNREARAETLPHFVLIFGTYWNLEIDTPYIETKDYYQDALTQVAQMRLGGYLDSFKNIAIDVMFWTTRPVQPGIGRSINTAAIHIGLGLMNTREHQDEFMEVWDLY